MLQIVVPDNFLQVAVLDIFSSICKLLFKLLLRDFFFGVRRTFETDFHFHLLESPIQALLLLLCHKVVG